MRLLPVLLLPLLLAATPRVAMTPPVLHDPAAVTRVDGNGRLRSSHGHLGALGKDPLAYIRANPALFGLRADEQLVVREDRIDSYGVRHVRVFRQLFGVPVEFDQIRLHARGTEVHAIEAELSDLQKIMPPRNLIARQRAEQLARGGDGVRLTQPMGTTLVVLPDSIAKSGSRLAWRVRIAFNRGRRLLPVNRHIYIDALTGRRLATLSRVMTDGSAGTMQSPDLYGNTVEVPVETWPSGVVLKDTSSVAGGSLVTVDASKNDVGYITPNLQTPFGDAEGVSVASNIRTALKFYKEQFGFVTWNLEDSPASAGGLLQGKAHYGDSFNNAYFTTDTVNGKVFGTMVFGDGDGQEFTPLAKCLDITGHEMGHALVSATADLVYHNQSGALNEHIADVFGWLMDPANDTIAEDCMGPGHLPLRNMCDPANADSPQPTKMSQFVKLPDDDDNDHGGVHDNSGIPNRAACVARNALGAGGGAKLGKVWFQALSAHLGATSTFDDMVAGTGAACGEVGLDAADCGAIFSGWVEVGLATASGAGGCPAHAKATDGGCVCDAGFQPDGGQCVAQASVSCPANAHADSGACYCDSGYMQDGQGACKPEGGMFGGITCPANSHLDDQNCVCDDCFQGATTGDAAGCKAVPGCQVCNDPASMFQGGSCQCIPGVAPDPDTKLCTAAIPGDCGAETFEGRCVGNTLIYCDDTTAGQPKEASVINCTEQKAVCGWDKAGAGFDCVPPNSNCGSIPVNGACDGATAKWCQDGVLQDVACGQDGCGPSTYKGNTIQFCNCPPHSERNANGECLCVSGFSVVDGACQPGTSGGSGPVGQSVPGASGGCVAGPSGVWPWTSLGALLLAMGGLVWRRRR